MDPRSLCLISACALLVAFTSAASAGSSTVTLTRVYQDLGAGPMTIQASGRALSYQISDSQPRATSAGAILYPGDAPEAIVGYRHVWAEAAGSTPSAAIVTPGVSTTPSATVSTPYSVTEGGTGATTASAARADLSAAQSGANSDITQISGLTTALPVTEGGTGATTAPTARSNLSAAQSGSNSDITALNGLTTALPIAEGGTGATTASGGRANMSAAQSGANGDITSLNGLTTPLASTARRITTGSSDAAGANDQTIVWASVTAAAKAESIPACSTSVRADIFVKDEQGTAATYNITITPTSGTIEGAATYVISTAKGAVRLRCDGAGNYMVM
jgi:hypothetical protein